MDMTPAQTELVRNLTALRQAVATTAVLKTVLDNTWFETIEAAIRSASPSNTNPADATGLLYDFCHPLRGVDWFEHDQELTLVGRLAEVEEDGKFAIALAGLDPLRTILPVIEKRLAAFAALPFKPQTVKVKLDELRAARTSPAFKNHLFELNVVGDLALRGVLVDIEDAATGVDGAVRIDGRDILIEATNTVQRVIPDFIGVFSGSPDVQVDQVIKKLRKKVADGRSLSIRMRQPVIEFSE